MTGRDATLAERVAALADEWEAAFKLYARDCTDHLALRALLDAPEPDARAERPQLRKAFGKRTPGTEVVALDSLDDDPAPAAAEGTDRLTDGERLDLASAYRWWHEHGDPEIFDDAMRDIIAARLAQRDATRGGQS